MTNPTKFQHTILKIALSAPALALAFSSPQAQAQDILETLKHFKYYEALYKTYGKDSNTSKRDKALAELKEMADKGDSMAKVELGLYHITHNNQKVPVEGAKLILEAAQTGHPVAQIHACLVSAKGWAGTQNWTAIATLCNQPKSFKHHPDVEAAYAEALLETAQTKSDVERYMAHLKNAANAQSPYARYVLGKVILNSDIRNKESQALDLFKQAARFGVPDAITYVAEFYAEGIAVEKDSFEAERLFDAAATAGAPFAIEWRKGPRTDQKQAYDDYEKSEEADLNFQKSQDQLNKFNTYAAYRKFSESVRELYAEKVTYYKSFEISCRVKQKAFSNCVTFKYGPINYMMNNYILLATNAMESTELDKEIDPKHRAYKMRFVMATEK